MGVGFSATYLRELCLSTDGAQGVEDPDSDDDGGLQGGVLKEAAPAAFPPPGQAEAGWHDKPARPSERSGGARPLDSEGRREREAALDDLREERVQDRQSLREQHAAQLPAPPQQTRSIGGGQQDGSVFMMRLAPNGQAWSAYCGAVPPAAGADGRLVGAWGECMNSAVVFEKTHADWQSMPGYEDGPAGQVVEFCKHCGFEKFAQLVAGAEEVMHEEMDAAQGDPLAFLQHRARNGLTWKAYCGKMEPAQDRSGLINGAWGDCLTAAVIFEKQNPEWSRLPAYMADGPAGQVLKYFSECGHGAHAASLERTEQATHQAMESGRRVPVYHDVYQAISGTQPAEEVGEAPPVMTGRRKALLVGCNYPGTSAELRGCVNDVDTWHGILQHSYGFEACDIVRLTDDQGDDQKKPTLSNIRSGLQWLTVGAQAGDALFFQFSGHGTQIPSMDENEADGKDEALCPTDYKGAGLLVDNEVYDLAVNGLQSGVKLTIILDCCHSGTAVDLPFIWTGSGWQEEAGCGFSAADVQMFSGCEDHQCSMDVTQHGRSGGAMTQSMSQAISENPEPTYPQLLERLHEILAERGMSQIPRLTSSQRFDPTGKGFSLCDGAIPNMNAEIGIAGQHRHHEDAGAEYESSMADILGISLLALTLGSAFAGDDAEVSGDHAEVNVDEVDIEAAEEEGEEEGDGDEEF